jgi:hypothetical protein
MAILGLHTPDARQAFFISYEVTQARLLRLAVFSSPMDQIACVTAQ